MATRAGLAGKAAMHAPQAPYASNVSSQSIPFRHTGEPLVGAGPTPELLDAVVMSEETVARPMQTQGETIFMQPASAMPVGDGIRTGTNPPGARPRVMPRSFTP